MMPCQPGSWVVIGHTFPRLELVGDFARRTWMMMIPTNWSFGGWNHQPAWYSGIAFTSFGTSSAPPQFPYHISPAVRKTCTERSFPCLSGKWLEHVREWNSVGEVFLVFLLCRSPADHWLSLRVNFTGDLMDQAPNVAMAGWTNSSPHLCASRRCPRLYYARNPRKALELASEATQAADFKEQSDQSGGRSPRNCHCLFFLSNYESLLGQWMIQSGFPPKSGMWMRRSYLLPVGSGHFPPCDLQRIGGGKRGWARPIIS